MENAALSSAAPTQFDHYQPAEQCSLSLPAVATCFPRDRRIVIDHHHRFFIVKGVDRHFRPPTSPTTLQTNEQLLSRPKSQVFLSFFSLRMIIGAGNCRNLPEQDKNAGYFACPNDGDLVRLQLACIDHFARRPLGDSQLMAAETTYIADYLEQHKDEILSRWRQTAKLEIAQAERLAKMDDRELLDHLPALTEALIGVLRGEEGSQVEIDARRHGHQRRLDGYSVVDVFWKLTTFRRVFLRRT